MLESDNIEEATSDQKKLSRGKTRVTCEPCPCRMNEMLKRFPGRKYDDANRYHSRPTHTFTAMC